MEDGKGGEYQWLTERGKAIEDDKSCQAIAVSWFMATVGQAGIVFNVHFKGGVYAHACEGDNVTLSPKSVHLSSPESM